MFSRSIFANIIKSFDLLATPIGLRLYGDTSIKSVVGALISILSLLGAIFLSLDVFQDFVYYRKPDISIGTIYNTNNSTAINFSSTDLYFALTIYQPNLLDLTKEKTVTKSPLNNYTDVKYFSDVNFDCIDCQENSIKFKLNLCKVEEFDKIELDSLPRSKQKIILDIFRNFSLCIPDGLNGTINDFDYEEYQEKLKRMNLTPFEVLKLDSTLTLNVPRDNKTIQENGVKYNTNNNALGNDIIIKNSNTISLSDNFNSLKRFLQTNPPSNPAPNNNINPQNNQQQDQQQQILKLQEEIKQLNSSSFKKNDFKRELKQTVDGNKYPKFLFITKNFRINPLANINIGESIYKSSFEFRVIDMRDLIKGTFKKYNIFVQENIIEITTPRWFFTEDKKQHRILTISKIEEDILGQNLDEGDPPRFAFKTTSEIPLITVKFRLFNDWLSSFGSYFNLCMLLASFLMGFFQDAVLNSNIGNSLFEILDNNETNFKLSILQNGGIDYIDKINKNIKKKLENLKRNNENQEIKINDFVFTKEEIEKYYESDFPFEDEDSRNDKYIEENNNFIELKKKEKINDNHQNLNKKFFKNDTICNNEIELSINNNKSKNINNNLNPQKERLNKNSLDIEKYNCENVCVIEKLKDNKIIDPDLTVSVPVKKLKIEERFFLFRKMNMIKDIAKKKIEISPHKFWLYISCKICKCLFNKDKLFIAEKSTDLITKNIEISEIIKKHFEFDFIKKLLLTEDELELFKYQFKYLNINNMDLSKKYMNDLYNGHLKEDDIEDNQYK
jgi:hypothetical protein